MGFTPCGAAEYEDGFEKVAIYVHTRGKPTHAARQLSFGSLPLSLNRFLKISTEKKKIKVQQSLT